MFSRSYDDALACQDLPWWMADQDEDERAADALALSRCPCGALVDDREAPQIAGIAVCADCFDKSRGVD